MPDHQVGDSVYLVDNRRNQLTFWKHDLDEFEVVDILQDEYDYRIRSCEDGKVYDVYAFELET